MHLLHERPVLDRAAIRRALQPSPLDSSILPPAFQALTASDLADQIEAVTITDEPIDSEEMSRLWSAIQSHYRPTAAYVVSVVLIEARKPSGRRCRCSRAAIDPRGNHGAVEPSLLPPFPTILSVDRRARSRRRGSARRCAWRAIISTGRSLSSASRTGCSTGRTRSPSARAPTGRDRRDASVRSDGRAGLAGGRLHVSVSLDPAGRDEGARVERRRHAARARAGTSAHDASTRDATTRRVT